MFFGFLSVIRSFYFSRTNLYRATEGVKTLWRQKWASPDKKDFIVLWMLEGQKPSDVNYSDVMSIERMLKLKNRKKMEGDMSPRPPPVAEPVPRAPPSATVGWNLHCV